LNKLKKKNVYSEDSEDSFLPHTEPEEVIDSVWILAEIFYAGQQSECRLAVTLQRHHHYTLSSTW